MTAPTVRDYRHHAETGRARVPFTAVCVHWLPTPTTAARARVAIAPWRRGTLSGPQPDVVSRPGVAERDLRCTGPAGITLGTGPAGCCHSPSGEVSPRGVSRQKRVRLLVARLALKWLEQVHELLRQPHHSEQVFAIERCFVLGEAVGLGLAVEQHPPRVAIPLGYGARAGHRARLYAHRGCYRRPAPLEATTRSWSAPSARRGSTMPNPALSANIPERRVTRKGLPLSARRNHKRMAMVRYRSFGVGDCWVAQRCRVIASLTSPSSSRSA